MKTASSFQATKNAMDERMARLRISESDLEEHFSRSSGPGGQNVNKVSTAVTLKHLPTNVSVTVQDSRSQAMNRQLARVRLLDALEAAIRERKQTAQSAAAKRRRQNSKRPRGLKERILEGKRRRSDIKKSRAKPALSH